MRIKLEQEQFPFLPGTNWVDIWNIFYLTEDNEIKYGFRDYFNTLRCYNTEEPFTPDFKKTAEVFPLLLQKLAEEASKLTHLDFGPESDKIAKIKYVREKYDLGLKEAKELVEEGGLPPTLKCWKLPNSITVKSNIPNSQTKYLVYVENKGVFPLYNILQNKHLETILDWQPDLSIEEVTPSKFYLYLDGDIMGIAPKAEYFNDNFKIVEEEINPSTDKLIGIYNSVEEAKSHYSAFKLGVELATKAVKERVLNFTKDYTPKFY